MSDFIVTVKDTKTGKINPYLSTKEDNHFWYELDPESFPLNKKIFLGWKTDCIIALNEF